MNIFQDYDIIVVGGGHAGCEAATAAARLGSKVLLITQDLTGFARMSCNPSIGGIAKGQIVREIDALGGFTGIVADKSMIQFRMLNRSKGPAMWSPRSQNDRVQFSVEWRDIIENTPGLYLWRDDVIAIQIKNDQVCGVDTSLGLTINAKAVIITAGTFLNGKIYIGKVSVSGGRIGEKPSLGLSENLKELGIETEKLKTGTPMRIDGRTIDFSVLKEQPGDENPEKFSFSDTPTLTKQRSCYLAYTSEQVHDILRTGFEFSPLFTGVINGVGPRYCPSIEDKIVRFAGKEFHQLFVEPDGWNTNEYYLNGFSSSLPLDVQYSALRKIAGFENAVIMQPGYAIEYDYFPPTQLTADLMSKKIENLYFAGQVNGTTGYEEAAAQGIMAGINAHLRLRSEEAFILKRHEAYIGVLIDDLISKGVDEPYRMFTSRAEHRLLLRQDNADIRLTPLSFKLGLAGKDRLEKVVEKLRYIENATRWFEKNSAEPAVINSFLEANNSSIIPQRQKFSQLILRPEISIENLRAVGLLPVEHFSPADKTFDDTLEIEVKYKSYIEREKDFAAQFDKFENVKLPPDFDYHKITNISWEGRDKLNRIRPATVAQASRISGVSPADIAVLIGWLRK
ncbi:MAG: tRNA uridine-5-carboxymethylaminomethyl(34) synthesis enzyme MnmG [Bacteroidetes bacterium GWF2_43_63]|nr:MAG: tRNA uridine-5-carboxymethylaminomethyl(34) synthesis enzyme MnmG [Bacteroidetes bacterium GWE2_42_42]OFY54454.1 MAG: tRNA uridine-5-carboxymethylaminomethyl(34) synthesis enzyme MnmG [Bacteroidetes bacterium GWF2_43_63]HBG70402.1 tRNA uridine-5-carboxymethylaminomethyl(34) synthesis enzyme MnmG [Bacteroidales bacterium]HCB63481.1 tRNA uridine-5-carboxymethylaminomethyl(34) synthesis enzyme MnmG [Bacteroidales bacterium]